MTGPTCVEKPLHCIARCVFDFQATAEGVRFQLSGEKNVFIASKQNIILLYSYLSSYFLSIETCPRALSAPTTILTLVSTKRITPHLTGPFPSR